ncbi:hypothetical protein OSTOST_24452 [Ostertagia ostertagi]
MKFDDLIRGLWEPCLQCAYSIPNNRAIYTFTVSKAATANNCSIFKLNIWMIGLVFKVIPCILLMFFSVGLVNKIRQAEQHRRKLTNVSMNNVNSCDSNTSGKKKSYKSDRTTTMLVVILAVFLITELPQGIISILCAIFTTDVHKLCITKQTTTASNFNFTQLQLQRKNSNKVRNKEYAPLATEAEEHRDECGSGIGSEDSRERVEQL